MGGPRDPRVPISSKWPTMLQWSSSEDEGGLGAGEGGWSESEEPLTYRAQGAPRWVYGATKKGNRFEDDRASVVGEYQPGEGGFFAQGPEKLFLTPGTPDLVWQDPLDFEEEDPGEQDAARSPWEEAKAGPGAASRMTLSGRCGRRREAADAPSGRCGGVGFASPDAAAWEEQRPIRYTGKEWSGVCRLRGLWWLRCGWHHRGGCTQDVESDESLEEGELGNSGSEAEW
ncbi:hypothetical protein NDU88_006032 [Pleurodeles waltl]|uniref:Uncharacterized protein n=1 Tax=Pleurodeles waltl TaxID=8319 RepID=A0AAV7SNL5_PLEWA|nr:hypothetical protein NDU88_006032 [Pleurodeles waltl]